MLRDRNLVPLSHQHQHALALCVRLDRALKAGKADAGVWQQEIAQIYQSEIRFHFEAEEKVLFPAAEQFGEMRELVKLLCSEHSILRGFFGRAEAGKLELKELQTFADTLAQHVRTEERQLFEECQRLMSGEEIARVGQGMQEYFETSGMPGASCSLRPGGGEELQF